MLTIPAFAKLSLCQNRCSKCKGRFCEHMVEEAGLYQHGEEQETRFFISVRCPRCNQAVYLMSKKPAGWIELAIEILAEEFPGIVKQLRPKGKLWGKQNHPITDEEVLAMKNKLRNAKSDGEVLKILGLKAKDLANHHDKAEENGEEA